MPRLRYVVTAIILLWLPVSSGQDAYGDVEAYHGLYNEEEGFTWQPYPNGVRYEDADILDAAVTSDSPEAITFIATVADRDASTTEPGRGPAGPIAGEGTVGNHWIYFTVHDADYALHWRESAYYEGSAPHAELHRVHPTATTFVTNVPMADAGESWSFEVPRDSLVGANSEPLLRGDAIEWIAMETRFAIAGDSEEECREAPGDPSVRTVCGHQLRDRYPDEGFLDPYVMTTDHAASRSDVFIDALAPVQHTNGGQTMFLFQIRILNAGEERDFRLEIEESPEDWKVDAAVQTAVGAGETRYLPVTVQVPAGHAHGVVESASVSVWHEDERLAAVPLSVSWVDPPQPAGHHARLYLHSGSHQGASAWIDTLPTHPNGTRNTIGLFSSSQLYSSPDGYRLQAHRPPMPLIPGLLIGLDADVEETGTLNLRMQSPYNAPASMAGKIMYIPDPRGGQEPAILFEVKEQEFALRTGGPFDAEFTIEPTEASDYLPVRTPGQMTLEFTIEAMVPHEQRVESLMEEDLAVFSDESFLDLPLNEFQLLPILTVPDRFEVEPAGPTWRQGNPGDAVIFDLDVRSLGGSQGVTAHVEPHGEFEAQVSAGRLTLDPGARLSVLFRVPPSVPANETLSAVLTLTDVADPTVHATLLLTVEVVVKEVQDDATRADLEFNASRKSSGLATGFIPLLVAAFLALRRNTRLK